MPNNDLRRRTLLGVAASGVTTVTGCLGGIVSSGEEDTPSPAAERTPTATAEPTPTERPGPTPTLELEDQQGEGNSVRVLAAVINDDGWVAVYPQAEGGGPNGETLLGKKYLESGTHADFQVPLESERDTGGRFYAMLHYDRPGDRTFSFPENGDPPAIGAERPVIKPFNYRVTANVRPRVTALNQRTDGTSVTVREAAINRAGWVAIYPDDGNGRPDLAEPLGRRWVPPGRSLAFSVPLDRVMDRGLDLHAVLHYDDPVDGEFAPGGGDDQPVTNNNIPISDSFATVVATSGRLERVSMQFNRFDPVRLSIEPGTTVRWINEDSVGHDIVSGTFDDDASEWSFWRFLSEGQRAARTFREEGIYQYYSAIHGRARMCGVVEVGDVEYGGTLPCE
jgi:plastocyanin